MMPENTTEGRLIAAETAQSLVPVHFRSNQPIPRAIHPLCHLGVPYQPSITNLDE